ncbi:MAG: ribonuclease M5 [Bacillota bacterium]
MKIKEVIVVEGKDDVSAVKRAVDAEIITTSGMGLNEEIYKKIEGAAQRCGIVILTDPDYPGEKIRSQISQRLSPCKHAYLDREEARCKNTGKLGVEYASPEAIRKALVQARVENKDYSNVYTLQDLCEWNLTGSAYGSQRRSKLGQILGIGKTNAKQFLKRLNSYNIPLSEVKAALLQIERLD